MTISDYEIRSWTTQGAQDAAKSTYASVKTALSRSAELARLDWSPFLQGSYANHTNTRGDSDVDIVAMLKTTYIPDLSQLGPQERARHDARSGPATVRSDDFRKMVHRALSAYYAPLQVIPKDKCLRVPKRPGYVDADVVPSLQLRRYLTYPEYGQPRVVEGIAIFPLSGGRITNFPKEHIANGEAKNARTSGAYKPTVRQVKRLRRKAVDDGLVGRGDAPGYVLECLVFNAPDQLFAGDEATRVRRIIGWLASKSARELFVEFWACDQIHRLFVDDPGDHDPDTAERVIAALASML